LDEPSSVERLWEEFKLVLENRLHRSPTDAEVAQQLGITTDELHQIFNQISFVSVVALDELLSVGSERGDRLTLAEIGQVLGVTESRVCQMHTKAVLQLRAKMQDAR
jgi:RNA polymerase sigma factor for flagellar operon FliA